MIKVRCDACRALGWTAPPPGVGKWAGVCELCKGRGERREYSDAHLLARTIGETHQAVGAVLRGRAQRRTAERVLASNEKSQPEALQCGA